MRRTLVALCAVALLWVGLCTQGERLLNQRVTVPLPDVSPRARALHAASFVVDLHADSLLTRRDLLTRSSIGHVDVPRLREGGVALQVFAVPTITPWNSNFERTEADAFDSLTWAGVVQGTALAWRGPYGRALWAAEKLRALAARDAGLVIIESRSDLAALSRLHEAGEPVTGALLALEGAHAAESDPENLERLFAAGYRMVGLTHFFDNEYAGSAHGVEKGGLTPLGRATVQRMQEQGIVVDLAHLSPSAIDDVLTIATTPLLVSHGGVQGTCPGPRTLSDAHLRAIAASGGVIGFGYFPGAVCGSEPRNVVDGMLYAIERVGDAHVALGSDYDGAVRMGFDTSQLPVLTQALLDAGLDDDAIRRVLGGNTRRVLEATLR